MKKLYWLGGIIAIVCLLLQGYVFLKTLKPDLSLGGREYQIPHTILNNVATSTWGTEYGVSDYRNIVLMLSCVNATATIKIAGSDLLQEDVDMSSAQSATNHWDYIEIIDLEDGTSIDGDTGISCTGSDYRRFAINDDLVSTLNAYTSSYTTGTVKLQIKYNNNQ